MFGWLRNFFRASRSYDQLVKRAGGEDAAERLIAFEIRRAPGLPRDRAIDRALDRLEYERSR